MRHGVRVRWQLRRLRWKLTAMFTVGTVLCLLTLAGVTAGLHRRAGDRALDADLRTRTAALASTASFDRRARRVTVNTAAADELVLGHPYLTVVLDRTAGPDGAVVYPVRPPSGPDLDVLRRLRPQVAADGQPLVVDLPGERGRWRAAVVAVPAPDGSEAGTVVMAGDRAPARRANDELLHQLLVGCLVLAAVAVLLGYQLARFGMRPVARALSTQEQFLAEASHELRTPLAALMLVAKAGAADPDRRASAMRDTVRLADRLGHLVTSLLTRARLQAGTLEVALVPLSLDQLVEQVVEDLPGAEAVAVDVTRSVVIGDPDLLAQAVRSMTEYALRQGADDDRPAMVEVTVADGVVAVRDHGLVPSSVRDGATSGRVGLSVVQWVAELHGAAFTVTDAAGGGVLATLRLAPRETGS